MAPNCRRCTSFWLVVLIAGAERSGSSTVSFVDRRSSSTAAFSVPAVPQRQFGFGTAAVAAAAAATTTTARRQFQTEPRPFSFLTRRPTAAGDDEEALEDGIEAAFYAAMKDSTSGDMKDQDGVDRPLPVFDEKETEQMTKEFFSIVEKRLENSPATDKKIWDALSSRAGFARVSLMLNEALQNRKDAKKMIKDALKDVGALEGGDQKDGSGSELAGAESSDAKELGEAVVGGAGGSGGEGGGGGGDSDDSVAGKDALEEVTLPVAGREDMTPTDVIDVVLAALKENDSPAPNNGINVLLSYMSDASAFGEVQDPSLFEEYIPSSASYSVLVNWEICDFPKKLEVSLDGSKAYQIVRLRDKRVNEWKKVKWTLSMRDGGLWCIDNVLVMTSRR